MPIPRSDETPVQSNQIAEAALTVVFATRNRAIALRDVLDRFSTLMVPDGGWKLMVVDNGSTDATLALLQSYVGRLPLTVLSEPRAGKNRALNSALSSVEGSLVVLTDDDVLPQADWLIQLQQAAVDHPEACFFGGTILPSWSQPKPFWLTEQAVPFSVLYSQQKRGAGACSYDAIFGPNMAVRRRVFLAGFRFSESVGPDETRHMYAMGSETEFLRRLEAAGYGGFFAPEAVVDHIIRPEQIDESWILKRAYRYGSGEGRHYIAQNPGLGGLLIWLPSRARLRLRALIYGVVACMIWITPRSPLRLKILYKARALAGAHASFEKAVGVE